MDELDKELYKEENCYLNTFIINPDIEPGVIDNYMLIQSILTLGSKDEAGRLFEEEGVHLDETTMIRLEFQKILRIDHLWMLTSLTKLTLAHNVIEKIENLEMLTKLKELDLSFNKIEKIENLDKLVNLEIFTLFHNKIKKLENMCNLTNLFVFSIGDNLIEDYKEMAYLRRFRKLRSVSLKGNPCCDDPMAYPFLASALGQVKYLDYKIITEEQRETGVVEFRGLLRMLDESDEIADKQRRAKEEYNKQVTLRAKSFVENLSGPELFNSMFENDPEGTILLTFGGELLPFLDLYKKEYVEIMAGLVEFAQEAYVDRQNEIKLLKDHVDMALDESVEKSKIVLLEYEKKKKDLMAQFTELTEKYISSQTISDAIESSIVEVVDEFNSVLYDMWKRLMTLETNLFEQCEESRVQFGVNMTEKIIKLQEVSRAAFGAWREQEGFWSMRQFETLSKHLGKKRMMGDARLQLTGAMMDRDEMINLLEQSSDNHLRFIDAREDFLATRSNNWRNEVVQEINGNEVKRNRSRILEINYFIDNQRIEWTDLQMALHEPIQFTLLDDEF